MIFFAYFIVLLPVILCIPLLPDQSVIPIFDNSRKNFVTHPSAHPTSANDDSRRSSRVVDVIEEWDFITPPPYKAIGTMVRAPDAPSSLHEVEEKVIATMNEDTLVYSSRPDTSSSSSSDSRKEQLFVEGEVAEKLVESHGTSDSGKHEEESDSSGETNLNSKGGPSAKSNGMTKCSNTSACFGLNTTSTTTAAPETTSSTSRTVIDGTQKAADVNGTRKTSNINGTRRTSDESSTADKTTEGAEFDSQVTDLLELLRALATFITPALSPQISSSTSPTSSLINSTDRSNEIELYEEDTETVTDASGKVVSDKAFSETDKDGFTGITGKTSDKAYSKTDGNEFEAKMDHKKGVVVVDDSVNLEDYKAVDDERNHGEVRVNSNSKLDPQVIPRSEFAKNGIEEHNEIGVMHGCSSKEQKISTAKEDPEKRKPSDCETTDEMKSWKAQTEEEADKKYDEEHGTKEGRKEPQVPLHFERTLWEKLVAGLKCAQRDCEEALRPTEAVRRYLMEPSISRARKHSNGGHSEQ